MSLEVQIQELEVQAAIKKQEEEKEEERLRIEEEERLRGTQFTCVTQKYHFCLLLALMAQTYKF